MARGDTAGDPAAAGLDRGAWVGVAAPLLLVALCLLLYLWRLGATPLRDFDEAYYAEGAREMLARGDLLTPYFNGQPFLLKPILVYWVVAAAFRLLGVTEFAARAPSAFLGTVVVVVTYAFAGRTLGRRAGLFAGLAVALCYMWMEIARDASIDIPLTAVLAPALFAVYLAPRASPAARRWWCLSCYPLLGIALLAKGPAPAGVVLVGLLCYLMTAGRLRQTLREGQVVPGLALLAVVAVPWYWCEIRHQPAFLSTFLIGEHFGHIGGELARREPVWGNLRYLLIFFFPWAAFLPASLVHAFRQDDRAHVLRLAAWWMIAVVVLFSIPRSKLAHYLAPAFPAMAILVGGWLDAWLRREAVSRVWAGVAFAILGVAGVLCAVGVCLALALPEWVRQRIAEQFGAWQPGLAPAVILCLLATGFFAALAAARWWRAAFVPLLASSMFAGGLCYVGWFRPRLTDIQARPRKELAQLASGLLSADELLGVYYAKRNSTVFYFRRPIVDLGERKDELAGVEHFLAARRPAALLTHERFVPQLERGVSGVHVLARRGAFVLLANQGIRVPHAASRGALKSATTSKNKGSRSREGSSAGMTGRR
jgi:4-amino-4-deoxy-L-arabinose transferase-like glycosyltransferase